MAIGREYRKILAATSQMEDLAMKDGFGGCFLGHGRESVLIFNQMFRPFLKEQWTKMVFWCNM